MDIFFYLNFLEYILFLQKVLLNNLANKFIHIIINFIREFQVFFKILYIFQKFF